MGVKLMPNLTHAEIATIVRERCRRKCEVHQCALDPRGNPDLQKPFPIGTYVLYIGSKRPLLGFCAGFTLTPKQCPDREAAISIIDKKVASLQEAWEAYRSRNVNRLTI